MIRTRLAATISFFVAFAAASAFGNTYTVVKTDDFGTGTLRDAVTQANANPGLDRVVFDIPSAGGPVNIDLMFGALAISDQIEIDGSTQPGFTTAPLVALKNTMGLFAEAMVLAPGSDGSIVNDMKVVNGTFFGIGSLISVQTSDSNVFHNCYFDGVSTTGPMTIHGLLINNSVGTIVNHCQIGSVYQGITISGSTNTWISDCAIGTDFTGLASYPCKGSGVFVSGISPGTELGPLFGDDANIIANCQPGVSLIANEARLLENRIYDVPDPSLSPPIVSSILPGIENLYARRANGDVRINGTLTEGLDNHFYRVQFFADRAHMEPTHDAARWYIGEKIIKKNGNTNFFAEFPDNLPDESNLRICATRAEFPNGGTSGLSESGDIKYITIYNEPNPGLNSNWVPSGIDSGPEYSLDPTTIDDVDVLHAAGELSVIVRPSVGRYRIAGWQNPAMLSTDDVGPDELVRGKFYVYTSLPRTAPLNTVPNFRLRLNNENVVMATVNYEYSRTGAGGLAREPFYDFANNPDAETSAGVTLRPSANPNLPSLYRVDFMPPYVPAAEGTNIGASFESFATQNPADGVLSLTEVALAVYPATGSIMIKTPRGIAFPAFEFSYTNYDGWVGIPPESNPWIEMQPGQFNAENDFQPGRLQTLDVLGEVASSELAQIFETVNDGTIIDTSPTPQDVFGVGIMTLASNDHTKTPRLDFNKIYMASFVVSSDLPTSSSDPNEIVQGGMNFQIQTAAGCVSSRLELAGPVPAGQVNTVPNQILAQTLPGAGCQLPEFFPYSFTMPPGENGSVYHVFLSTPLDINLFPDVLGLEPTVSNGNTRGGGNPLPQFALFSEPEFGVNLPSARDISIGVNAIQAPLNLRLTPSVVVPWAQPNNTRVRVLAAQLDQINQIDDGGYAFRDFLPQN